MPAEPICLSCRRVLVAPEPGRGDLSIALEGPDFAAAVRDLRPDLDEDGRAALAMLADGTCRVCGRPYPTAAR